MSTTEVKEFTNVNLKIEDRVGIVYIANPPANALNSDTINGLSDCIDYLDRKVSGVKVIIITGEGRFFVPGADIKEFKTAIGDVEIGEVMAKKAQALFNKIEQLEKPVIAVINGACLGGGMELAMSCHMRLAAEDAVMGQPELNLGLIPGFGGTQRLPRLTNTAKALELILTSEFIKGKEAENIGLVNRSYPYKELMKEAIKLANKIANEKSAISIAATLKAVNTGIKKDLYEGLELEARLFGEMFGTKDMEEGVLAFVEKRKANFIDQ
ncbi:enoyl-CoA hydratase-related protein [Fredinandcohnia sp. FSL W7-1320]|uniref:enoyl-CoA hydratase-related protein n=1 Tax=Fredinandcohnia sp. FSL W7-1320 TaxID=2954540 RepID=UPI0030FDB8D8